jgi:hypothetical protein
MLNRNVSFCLQNCPRIAEQLRLLPPSSPDRRLLEQQIAALSQRSLASAERLFEALARGLYHPDHETTVGDLE